MTRRVVLASQSPRRLQLLRSAGCDVEVRLPTTDERWVETESGHSSVLAVARNKLEGVGRDHRPVLAADTMVFCDDAPLGKPGNVAHAQAMLRRLAGREHRVVTGFCLAQYGRVEAETVETRVWFRPLSEAEIHGYIASGEPFDKAGGYGIQGAGGALVDRIEGSYTNVVGLPLREVLACLDALQEPGA